jgi:hypothetical protein
MIMITWSGTFAPSKKIFGSVRGYPCLDIFYHIVLPHIGQPCGPVAMVRSFEKKTKSKRRDALATGSPTRCGADVYKMAHVSLHSSKATPAFLVSRSSLTTLLRSFSVDILFDCTLFYSWHLSLYSSSRLRSPPRAFWELRRAIALT